MGIGRFFCVGFPFALTALSLVFLLVANLGSISDSTFYMFKVNTQDFSINPNDIHSFENSISKRGHFSELTNEALTNAGWNGQSAPAISEAAGATGSGLLPPPGHFSELTTAALSGVASGIGASQTVSDDASIKQSADATSGDNSGNITASQLGLADYYQVSLWRLCSTTGSQTNCTSAKFNWARDELNITEISTLVASTGVKITLPTSLTNALNTFDTAVKWAEILYIIATVLLGVELIVGLFGFCSRIGSCLTWHINGFSTTAVVGASVLVTIISTVTVTAINNAIKPYGASASVQTRFLAITWLSALFSISAGLFWLFSMCCCAPDRSSKRQSHSDGEKLLPNRGSGYARVEDPHGFDANTAYGPQTEGLYNYQHPVGRQSAYEPFTHTKV